MKNLYLVDISPEDGGVVKIVIDNHMWTFLQLIAGNNSCTVRIDRITNNVDDPTDEDLDLERIGETANGIDYFYKAKSSTAQLWNTLSEEIEFEGQEVIHEAELETLAQYMSKVMETDEAEIILRGLSEKFDKIKEITTGIISEKKDGEVTFRLRLDENHEKCLSSKDPTAYISASGWASCSPPAFKTAYVEASAGGFEIDMPDDNPEIIINEIKGMLNSDVEDQRPRQERILDLLIERLHHRIDSKASGGLTTIEDPDIGAQYYADAGSEGEPPVIWVPETDLLDEIEEIINKSPVDALPEVTKYGIQRGIFTQKPERLYPHGSPISCYPVDAAEIERDEMCHALLESLEDNSKGE